ncbi:MAG: ATP-grasp domain-containing protein [Lachnospiraceae bacterium]|nr:ATP-grasp domain-containing protein [Lachnospiraceae bacterium]
MNILILSAGTRDKVVQYFKSVVGTAGKVIATDCSDLAPAIYEADEYVIVPRIDAEGYIDGILEICKEKKIDGVLSLIDPELSMLAEHRESFRAVGTTCIVPDYELVEICFDKYRMYELLTKYGYPTAKSYVEKEAFYQDVQDGKAVYPVFVKPVRGSASMNISKVNSQKEVDLLFELYDDLMIQEYMDGTEYGADVYIDLLSGKVTSIFIKEKIKMRAGETDKAVSIKDDALFTMIREFVERAGFRGIIDIDIFKVNGTYYISEVNPRFGGGYPHAFACGVNVPAQILMNLSGKENPCTIGEYQEGICMMKYNEIMIR